MRLRYGVSQEDFVFFQLYHAEHSPSMRRTWSIARWGVPIVSLAMTLPVVKADAAVAPLVGWAIFSAGFVLFAPRFNAAILARHARRMLREGANRGILGEHELELTPDRLVERTPYGEHAVQHRAIERIAEADGYTIIYVGSLAGHIIPHSSVTEGHVGSFIAELRRRIDSSGGPTSPISDPDRPRATAGGL